MNTITVPISNDPNFGFKRTATLASVQINALPFMGKNIIVSVQIDYFESETDTPITIIPSRIINLTAIGEEFEYYMSLFNQSIIIQQLVIAQIQEADQNGKFN